MLPVVASPSNRRIGPQSSPNEYICQKGIDDLVGRYTSRYSRDLMTNRVCARGLSNRRLSARERPFARTVGPGGSKG